MKKVLSAAAFLLCFAGSLYAQGYLYPTGPAGGPALSCPGCPPPRTSVFDSTLGKVYPYGDPIIDFHRFVDSVWVKDWQQPFRTARAFRAVHVPSRNRIYMIIGGGAFVAYNSDTFINRLKTRETLAVGAQRTDGKDLYLRPDQFFYPENKATGWVAQITDGQERLYGFDWDDRGLVYMAYTYFGWGIARDDGRSDGSLMTSVLQGCGEPDQCSVAGKLYDATAASNIFVLKSSTGRYYVYVGEGGQMAMRVYDVTDPGSPIKQADLTWQPGNYAKMGNYFAVANGKTIDVYTNDGFISRGGPIASVQAPGGSTFSAVTTDGSSFYAVTIHSGSKLLIVTIDVAGGAVSSRPHSLDTPYGFDVVATNGYLVARNSGDAYLFRLVDGTPHEIPLNKWILNYYARPPSGYVAPPSDHSSFQHASPLHVAGKVYMILSFYALGDVIEVRAGDTIATSVTGTHGGANPNAPARAAGDLFLGDDVGFLATSNGSQKLVNWNFGNPEGSDANTESNSTGQQVFHTFSGFTPPATKQVKATADTSDSTVGAILKAPEARFRIYNTTHTSFLFTQPNASSPAPIVLGDFFADASDGDLSGHYVVWNLDGTASTKEAGSTIAVGDCGAHALSFAARYGYLSGLSVVGSAFERTISPFNYTVRPFAAAIFNDGTNLTFGDASRPAGLTLTRKWDLVDANDVVIEPGPTNPPDSIWTVPASKVVNGSRVRLKLTSTAALPAGCTGMTESVAYSQTLNPPDPVIAGGCPGGGPPCEFTVTSGTNPSLAGWTLLWEVTPSSVTASSFNQPTFKPTFSSPGTYAVSVTATNAIASTKASKVEVVTTAGSTCTTMNAVTVFADYFGPASGCTPNVGSCSTSESINFRTGSFGYDFGCATHTFTWTFPGGVTMNGRDVSRALSSGSHQVTLTVSNQSQTHTNSVTVTVGFVSQPPAPPPPPPPPTTPGSCLTMNALNVFVGYRNPSGSCDENHPTAPCGTGETITLSAKAFGYDFGCANHSFTWNVGGQVKMGQTVTHIFSNAASHPVSLTIGNSSQTFTATASIPVGGASTTPPPAPPPPPPAPGGCLQMSDGNVFIAYRDAFNSCNQNDPNSVCQAGQPIDFNAAAFNYNFDCASHSFTWDFGSGGTKTGQNVQHTFFSAGLYPVKLTVNNGTQTFTPAAPTIVRVGALPITGTLSVSIEKELILGLIYKFTPKIDPPEAASSIHSYVWNFGDSKSLTMYAPDSVLHEYSEPCPSCTVTLTVLNASGQPVAAPATLPLSPARRRSAGH
ncbi:MAG TPA: PKD domain-containing protein [Thermoanaerobaculia bacterium]|nr:PKD domain-containing protein [Thermoanaerobaculia bacterium]